MKKTRIQISAAVMALILFLALYSKASALPLTETIYLIPEDEIEFYFHEEIYTINKDYRKDIFGVGLGILTDLSLWFQFEYLHQGVIKSKKGEVGDLFLKIKYFIGDYNKDTIHIGFLFNFRFPTGKNAYASTDWRNLALGKNDIKLGPYFQFDIFSQFFLHFNIFYTFREGRSEDFYGGFYVNIFKKETWVKLFGLNPVQKGTFLNKKRVRNDFITLSLGINSNVIYPFIPFIEMYSSFCPYKGESDTKNVPIEGSGINPALLLSCGMRFFFLESTYLGLYTAINPLKQKNYIKMMYGLEFNIQF